MGSKKNVPNHETLSVVKYFLAETKIHVRSSRMKFAFRHCKIDDIDPKSIRVLSKFMDRIICVKNCLSLNIFQFDCNQMISYVRSFSIKIGKM